MFRRYYKQLICQQQFACLVLTAILSVAEGTGQNYCGESLVEVMAYTCGERGYYGMSSGIHGRSVSRSPFMSEERANSFLTTVQTRNRRRTGRIVTECCHNRCTRKTLESYCNAAPTQLPTELTTASMTTTEPAASPRRNSRNIAAETVQPPGRGNGDRPRRPGKGQGGRNTPTETTSDRNERTEGGEQPRRPKCGKKKIREGRCPIREVAESPDSPGGQRSPDTTENERGNDRESGNGRNGGGSSRGGSSQEGSAGVNPTRGDSSRGDSSRGESTRGDSTRGGSSRGGALRGESARESTTLGGSTGGDSTRSGSSRGGASRGGSSRGGSSRGETTRNDAEREDPTGDDSTRGDTTRGDSARGESSRGGSRGNSREPKQETSSGNGNTETDPVSSEDRNSGGRNSNRETETTSSESRNNGGKGSNKLSKAEKKRLRKLERQREKDRLKEERQKKKKKKSKKKKGDRERRTTGRWIDGLSRRQQILRSQRLLSYRTQQRSYEYMNAIRRMIGTRTR